MQVDGCEYVYEYGTTFVDYVSKKKFCKKLGYAGSSITELPTRGPTYQEKIVLGENYVGYDGSESMFTILCNYTGQRHIN